MGRYPVGDCLDFRGGGGHEGIYQEQNISQKSVFIRFVQHLFSLCSIAPSQPNFFSTDFAQSGSSQEGLRLKTS